MKNLTWYFRLMHVKPMITISSCSAEKKTSFHSDRFEFYEVNFFCKSSERKLKAIQFKINRYFWLRQRLHGKAKKKPSKKVREKSAWEWKNRMFRKYKLRKHNSSLLITYRPTQTDFICACLVILLTEHQLWFGVCTFIQHWLIEGVEAEPFLMWHWTDWL